MTRFLEFIGRLGCSLLGLLFMYIGAYSINSFFLEAVGFFSIFQIMGALVLIGLGLVVIIFSLSTE